MWPFKKTPKLLVARMYGASDEQITNYTYILRDFLDGTNYNLLVTSKDIKFEIMD